MNEIPSIDALLSAAMNFGGGSIQAWSFAVAVNLGAVGWAIASRRGHDHGGLAWPWCVALFGMMISVSGLTTASALGLQYQANLLLAQVRERMGVCPADMGDPVPTGIMRAAGQALGLDGQLAASQASVQDIPSVCLALQDIGLSRSEPMFQAIIAAYAAAALFSALALSRLKRKDT